jgi:hypothetical protein
MRDDVTLMKLRQLSKDQHESVQRKKMRQERLQQRTEAGEVRVYSGIMHEHAEQRASHRGIFVKSGEGNRECVGYCFQFGVATDQVEHDRHQ